ncbi:MAG: PQQ-binding-like beta-propeller repeat protein [Euryarchaeota archaeon]|nr:PQQ-binding-like beta-propeller repeat protein [Euryarchaeota archaeon]
MLVSASLVPPSAAQPGSSAEGWPFEHGGVGGNRLALEPIPTFIETAWKANVTGAAYPLVVGNRTVFGASAEGEVVALDAMTGETKWRKILPEPIAGAPGYAKDTLVVAAKTGRLYALHAATGAPLWAIDTGEDPTSPLIHNAAVYVASTQTEKIYAIDLEKGTSRWTVELGGKPAGRLAAEGLFLLVVRLDGTTLAYGTQDGVFIWKTQLVGVGRSGAAVAGKKVYVVAPNGFLTVQHTVNGTETWFLETPVQETLTGPPAVSGDAVAFTASVRREGYAYSVFAKNGTEKWKVTMDPLPVTPMTTDGSTLVFGTSESKLVALDGSDGSLVWQYNVGTAPTSPAAAYGHLYASTAGGDIIALRTATVNNPPNVTVEFPIQGDTVTGVVDVIGRATDPDSPTQVRFVEWRIDSGLWRRANGTATWLAKWDTATIAQGVHVLQARASDGNLVSEPVNVTLFVSQGGGGRIPLTPEIIVVAFAIAASITSRRRT